MEMNNENKQDEIATDTENLIRFAREFLYTRQEHLYSDKTFADFVNFCIDEGEFRYLETLLQPNVCYLVSQYFRSCHKLGNDYDLENILEGY